MRLNKIEIKNFKCFENESIKLHPKLNILMGNNGTGKTSLLEAFRILIGSLYLAFDKYKEKIEMPGIVKDDIRLKTVSNSLEPQIPTNVSANAVVDEVFLPTPEQPYQLFDNNEITWLRSMETFGGKTTTRDAKEMFAVSKKIQEAVRQGDEVNIPLVAYFSTDRYKKERRDTDISKAGSRMRGYFNALDTTTNTKFFLDLYYTETLDEIQNNVVSPLLAAVNAAVRQCLDCQAMRYNLKSQELLMVYDNGDFMPFNLLSDGIRCTLAMVMEIAFRCYLLNPHLGENAPAMTKGVVLVDEIDLHLHPSWQLHILNDLRAAFPEIQFIVTTHAPLVISQIHDCNIYSISEHRVYDFPSQNGRDANYILQQMNVPYIKPDSKDMLDRYFGLIDSGKGKTEEAITLRKKLQSLLGEDHAELRRADMLLSFF